MLFANFAEAMAEGRGKAQADFLRRTKTETTAKRMHRHADPDRERLRAPQGRRVRVEAGDLIPADGDVAEGAATVDESAITGESAPVIREAGGDRSRRHRRDARAVRLDRGGRQGQPRRSFLDRMIGLVEGAQRQKTPNEIALVILLAGLTIVFIVAVATASHRSRSMPAPGRSSSSSSRCSCA